jgi:malonyl-CoA O-methyltransferase
MPKDRALKSNAIKEFSRFAHQYNQYNVIQAQVAEYLLSTLEPKYYPNIIDMGCGAGEVYKNLKNTSCTFDSFIAIDSSSEMLEEHPSCSAIEKKCENFNTLEAFHVFNLGKKDIFISSSALQWSKDLDFTFKHISQKALNIHVALFTSNTFKTLHQIAKLPSPIYSSQILESHISNYYQADYEIKSYRLYFKNKRAMFQYIKKSGVSGGEKRLSFKETKNLIQNYPLEYLEFEVLFVRGLNKRVN